MLLRGNCLQVLKTLPDCSVDSIVTDPPYELGFMGKSWDNSGIAYNTEVWEQCLRVLKPGGHLLDFGGTRTYHRLAVAIEDAGFEIRDSIHWTYGSGFPKSLNVGKGLDDWEGWGTALKPSHEPIVVARKPLVGTVANNVLAYGTGALNIDGTRVGTIDDLSGGSFGGVFGAKRDADGKLPKAIGSGDKGRWPANTILTHSADCGDECAEGCPVKLLDEQSGISTSRQQLMPLPRGHAFAGEIYGNKKGNGEMTLRGRNDTGGASRYFTQTEYTEPDFPPFIYQAKAGKKERNAGLDEVAKNFHPTVKPVALMRHLIKLVTPPNGIVLDPFLGSGTTAVAATLEEIGRAHV